MPRIYFVEEHRGGLFELDPISGEIKGIETGLGELGNLTYSRQLHSLAFTARIEHEEPESLYILDLSKDTKRQVYDGSSSKEPLYRPMFDPSGEFLYAVNYEAGIHKYSIQSGEWSPVSVSGAEDLNPQGLSFSDSGKLVAISPGPFNCFYIARVTPQGFVVDRTVLSEFDSCTSPTWIGDSALVFLGRKSPGLQFVWKIDLDTGDVSQLTRPPVGARDFMSLSPDRASLVFTATNDSQWRLWTITLDGSEPKQLTQDSEMSSHLFPVWIDYSPFSRTGSSQTSGR